MYTNPVIPGFCPDPSVTFHKGRYYLVTSTFEYFPGITVWSCTDLVNWRYHSSILTRESQLDLSGSANSSGLYAATIRVNANGRFYVVCTNKFTHQNFICHTDDINGPWSEISFISEDGIDPSIFFTKDGRCYYCSNGKVNGVKGIKGAFIDPDTGKLLQDDFTLLTTGCGGPATEGPHIYYRQGWYYLMIAEGGTEYGHYEAILRSRDIEGPYVPNPDNPILGHFRRKGHPIQATGHADLIKDTDGNWHAVFLGFRTLAKRRLHHLGRETFLAPVKWEKGWPVIGDNGSVELEMEYDPENPGSGPVQEAVTNYSFLFTKPVECQNCLRIRVPKPDCYHVDAKGRKLLLRGEDPVNAPLGHPTLLAFRQRGFREHMLVHLDLSTLSGTAGIAAWVSSDYHYRLQVKETSRGFEVKLIRHIHDFEATAEGDEIMIAHKGEMVLEITGTETEYCFFADGNLVGRASAHGLAAEGTIGNTFTGAMFAVYSENGQATFLDCIRMESMEN